MEYKYEKNVVAEIKELGARYKAPSFYTMADEVREVYAKAEAFDEIVEVFKDYPLKTDSDVMDFIQAKLDDMEDK